MWQIALSAVAGLGIGVTATALLLRRRYRRPAPVEVVELEPEFKAWLHDRVARAADASPHPVVGPMVARALGEREQLLRSLQHAPRRRRV